MKNEVPYHDTSIPRFGEFVLDPKTNQCGMVWAAKYDPSNTTVIGSELKLSDGQIVEGSPYYNLMSVEQNDSELLKAKAAGIYPFVP